MAGWDDLWGWMTKAGTGAYNWAGDNPAQAASLGIGALGTGMGIYDQWRASQAIRERQKLAEQLLKSGPQAYEPNWSPEQLQARYFRPAAQNMAMRGQTEGGAFRDSLADAALKAEYDRNQMGVSRFGAALNSLGYGPTVPATGSVGGLGQSLQNIMLMNALRQRPQQETGAASFGAASQGGDAYDRIMNQQMLSTFQGQIPDLNLYGGRMTVPQGGTGYSLTNFGQQAPYPQQSVGGFYPDYSMENY